MAQRINHRIRNLKSRLRELEGENNSQELDLSLIEENITNLQEDVGDLQEIVGSGAVITDVTHSELVMLIDGGPTEVVEPIPEVEIIVSVEAGEGIFKFRYFGYNSNEGTISEISDLFEYSFNVGGGYPLIGLNVIDQSDYDYIIALMGTQYGEEDMWLGFAQFELISFSSSLDWTDSLISVSEEEGYDGSYEFLKSYVDHTIGTNLNYVYADGGQLKPGALYRITDYATTHWLVDAEGLYGYETEQVDDNLNLVTVEADAIGSNPVTYYYRYVFSDGTTRTQISDEYTYQVGDDSTQLNVTISDYEFEGTPVLARIFIGTVTETYTTAIELYASDVVSTVVPAPSIPYATIAALVDIYQHAEWTSEKTVVEGSTEPLIVRALTNDSLEAQAYSEDNPFDFIQYYYAASDYQSIMNFYDPVLMEYIPNLKGIITYRKDKYGNEGPWDIRAIKIRVYAAEIPEWDVDETYEPGSVVLADDTNVYYNLAESTGETPGESDNWLVAFNYLINNNYVLLSASPTEYEEPSTENSYILVPAQNLDYIDVLCFGSNPSACKSYNDNVVTQLFPVVNFTASKRCEIATSGMDVLGVGNTLSRAISLQSTNVNVEAGVFGGVPAVLIGSAKNYIYGMDIPEPAEPQVLVTDVTYADLVTAIGASELIPGGLYRITDYATKHYLFDYDTRLDDTNTGATEPLIVRAIAVNAIGSLAFSETYPQDIIHYDWNPDNWIADLAYADAENEEEAVIITGFKGVITFRHDTINDVSTGFDWRNVKSRRWQKDVVDNGFTSAFTGLASSSVGITDPPVTADLLTFGTLGLVTSVHIAPVRDNYTIYNTFATHLINTVFLDGAASTLLVYNTNIGSDCFGNTIGNESRDNTIGDNMNGNTIGRDFSRNEVGSRFEANIVGYNFIENTIGHSMSENTIGRDFYRNQVGSGFVDNIVGAYAKNNSFHEGVNSTNFTNETLLDNNHNKTIFTRSDGAVRISYVNDSDVQVIQAITT